MLNKTISPGMFKGLNLTSSDSVISHLQFADDTIIFLEGMDSIASIKRILQGFQLLSELKINFKKSKLYSCSQESQQV